MRTFLACSVLSVFLVCVLCANVDHDSTINEGSECVTADAKPGICRSNCSTLSQAQLRSCGTKNLEIKVCCPRVSYPILAEACSYRTQMQKVRNDYFGLIDRFAKDEYTGQNRLIDRVAFTVNDKVIGMIRICELESRTIGGRAGEIYKDWCDTFKGGLERNFYDFNFNAPNDKYPHMALLGWRNPRVSISWNCAGALVHESFVLTTAHCIVKYGKPPDLVRFSEQTLIRRGQDKSSVDYEVDKAITHGSFDPSKLYNDIALLKIKLKSDLGDIAPPLPICIWTRDDFPTTNFRTLGFGPPTVGLTSFLSLRDNYAAFVPKDECSKSYTSNPMLPDGFRESQLCGSDPKRVPGGCKDQSGGPLQFTDEMNTPYLIGIASFGLQCQGAKPGIYTRAYDFLDWIELKIKENML